MGIDSTGVVDAWIPLTTVPVHLGRLAQGVEVVHAESEEMKLLPEQPLPRVGYGTTKIVADFWNSGAHSCPIDLETEMHKPEPLTDEYRKFFMKMRNLLDHAIRRNGLKGHVKTKSIGWTLYLERTENKHA